MHKSPLQPWFGDVNDYPKVLRSGWVEGLDGVCCSPFWCFRKSSTIWLRFCTETPTSTMVDSRRLEIIAIDWSSLRILLTDSWYWLSNSSVFTLFGLMWTGYATGSKRELGRGSMQNGINLYLKSSSIYGSCCNLPIETFCWRGLFWRWFNSVISVRFGFGRLCLRRFSRQRYGGTAAINTLECAVAF